MTQQNNKNVPMAAAAAMMKLTMGAIEREWGKLQPVFAAYTPQAVLTKEQEDELFQELYVAALALELYDLQHFFDASRRAEIEAELLNIMASAEFESLQLAESMYTHYLPRLRAIPTEDNAELGMALIQTAVRELYNRLPLPLKPADAGTSLIAIKLVQSLPALVGKWPVVIKGFDSSAGSEE
ncbi:hypothetical protein [Paenibacillus cremeus]|uniref:Uncharacterized protein n=1 Tax=Paenibacillus cremeus TaxID=2163881 RepID=A0A559KA49_9BACL|nr:hypothetical protein [Paenibacillus cremeus]TVY08992.1 hypothetical protein FPZ49_16040 [Paenibacillus cremeus]